MPGIHDTLVSIIRTHIGDSTDQRDRAILAVLPFCDLTAVELLVKELQPDFPFKDAMALQSMGWHP